MIAPWQSSLPAEEVMGLLSGSQRKEVKQLYVGELLLTVRRSLWLGQLHFYSSLLTERTAFITMPTFVLPLSPRMIFLALRDAVARRVKIFNFNFVGSASGSIT